MAESQSVFIKSSEAARVMGIDAKTVRKMSRQGELPKLVALGKQFYLDRKEFFDALKKLQGGTK